MADQVERTGWQPIFRVVGLWLIWILVTIVGLNIAAYIIFIFFLAAHLIWHGTALIPPLLLVTAGVALGGVILGGIQWLVLRRRIKEAGRWIGMTTLGLIAAEVLILPLLFQENLEKILFMGEEFPILVHPIFSIVLGSGLGLCQWAVLRRTLKGAAWWILATALGWVLSSLMAMAFFKYLPLDYDPIMLISILGGEVLIGSVTGIALVCLLDYSGSYSLVGKDGGKG